MTFKPSVSVALLAAALIASCFISSVNAQTCSASNCPASAADRNSCRRFICQNGRCIRSGFKAARTPCDDGNPCTTNDVCNAAGTCAGTRSSSGSCTPAERCATSGRCSSGTCVATTFRECSTNNPCQQAVCNPANGRCETRNANENRACGADDGNPCTSAVCKSGRCVTSNANENRACGADDGNPCTSAPVCKTGVCLATRLTGATCTLSNRCQIASCNNGNCVATGTKTCTTTAVCKRSVCNPENGRCEESNKPDGTNCYSGSNKCITATCQNGQCVQSTKTCPALGLPCVNNVCNPTTGDCVRQNVRNGNSCNDGDLCTRGDTCQDGKCVAGDDEVSCPDSDEDDCVYPACDPKTGRCTVTLKKADGLFCLDDCLAEPTCKNGQCQGPQVCQPEECRINPKCTPGGDEVCSFDIKPDGSTCDDDDKCTINDKCADGQCAGEQKQCPAPECQVSECDSATGNCVFRNDDDGTDCDDGDPCTENDKCKAGKCAGTPKNCGKAGDECGGGTCNKETGECEATNPDLNGSECEDNDACTETSYCAGGICVGDRKECPGDSPATCKMATCDKNTGECGIATATDGTVCNEDTGSTCQAGTCKPPAANTKGKK